MVRHNRRQFLGSIASAGALSGIAGVASAASGDQEAGGLLDVNDGQVEMNVGDDDGNVVSQSEAGNVDRARLENIANKAVKGDGPAKFEGKEVAAFLSKGVEMLNEAADAGDIEIGRQNGEVVVTPTAQAADEVSGSPTQSRRRHSGSRRGTADSNGRVSAQVHDDDCGDTFWKASEPGWTDPYVRHDIALSNDDTKNVITALDTATLFAGLASALSATSMAGAPLAIVCAIIVFATQGVKIILAHHNHGCGVLIDVNHLPLPPGPAPPIPELTFSVDFSTQHS